MKNLVVFIAIISIFMLTSGFQPPPCEMKMDGGDPFHPVFIPDKKGVFDFGVYRRGKDGTWLNKVPVWEIAHPDYKRGEKLPDTKLEITAIDYGAALPGFKVTHPPEKCSVGIRYQVYISSLEGYCSREFEIVEKDGGYELGQCPPDTTARAERDGCLYRAIWFMRERLPNGDWGEPKILPEPKGMSDGWEFTTCRDYHQQLERHYPFEVEDLTFDLKEICFLDDPRIDRTADVFTVIAFDSQRGGIEPTPEMLADKAHLVIFYCYTSANQGKKCSCSDEDINTLDGILNCSE